MIKKVIEKRISMERGGNMVNKEREVLETLKGRREGQVDSIYKLYTPYNFPPTNQIT